MEDRTLQVPQSEADAEAAGRGPGMPAVVMYDGEEIGEVHCLTRDETVVGRTAGCDIVVPEPRVSRRHLVIRRLASDGHDFEVVDLDSTNGTSLNGERVGRAHLRNGDRLGVGDRVLRFALLDETDLTCRSRISGLTHIDDLTGVLTTRSVRRVFDLELMRALRYRRPLSVLLMAIDAFQELDETYGDAAGPRCLAEVGRLIRESTRTTDVSGRYGESAFLTVLPETDTEGAMVAAERLRGLLARRTFHFGDTAYQARLSIGVASAPADGREADRLIAAATEALDLARRRGSNCSVIHEPSL